MKNQHQLSEIYFIINMIKYITYKLNYLLKNYYLKKLFVIWVVNDSFLKEWVDKAISGKLENHEIVLHLMIILDLNTILLFLFKVSMK